MSIALKMALSSIENCKAYNAKAKYHVYNCMYVDKEFLMEVKTLKEQVLFARTHTELMLKKQRSGNGAKISFLKDVRLMYQLQDAIKECKVTDDLLKSVLPKKGKRKNKKA